MSMKGVTVASALLADMAGSLTARSIDVSALFASSGVGDPSSFPARIPAAQMAAFWRAALHATGDADLGLHLAESFTPGALDIVGYVMLSSRSALDALERGARLVPLLNDGLRVSVHAQGAVHVVRLEIHPAFAVAVGEELRQIVETILAGLIRQLRLLTGAPIRVHAVHLQHAAPSHGVDEHTRVFGVAPHMRASEYALSIESADLARPVRSFNPALLVAFDALADDALRALQRDRRTTDRVLRAIMERLKGAAPSMTTIARALAMSARSVQRALAEEGTTYQQLLDEARREIALRHLRDPSVTVAHVAWLVGYSEPAAFHRAFRRWTGRAPRGG
ncbi:MAG: AraC family transcriptional regulator [Gemmatimonadaceae bacterium]|jgi:AraC-like DNA-binding protein|nr:AraC family transcriptional regulator [Gemmatimonadaceae bacterium]